MIRKLENREVLNDGTVLCNTRALLEVLYSGKDLNGSILTDKIEVEKFKLANITCDSTIPAPIYADSELYNDINWRDYWTTPEEYKSIDLKNWCHSKCKTEEEISRVNAELAEFETRKMIPIMLHLIYCVDVWRKNGIVWGVGRGSSVSSFVLYLIGINRVNPLKYNLDLAEWLK